MAKLTDTQLVILSSASRRNDRGVDLPANVTGEAVRKAVDRLIRTGLLEEVRANGSLLAWRRDAEAGPMALRITKQGLEAIGVKDVAVGAPMETSVSPAPDRTEVFRACHQHANGNLISLDIAPALLAPADEVIECRSCHYSAMS